MKTDADQLKEWLLIARDMITQYRDYSKAMRELGRGFTPESPYGHRPDDVIQGITAALEFSTADAMRRRQENLRNVILRGE